MDNTELRHHCYAMGYSDGEVGAFYDGYEKGKADGIGVTEITEEDFALIEADHKRTKEAFRVGYIKGRAEAIDEFANWLVEQGILGNRCISDGEITDYGKVYAKKYKEQLNDN